MNEIILKIKKIIIFLCTYDFRLLIKLIKNNED
jgi:hypothetical protein